MLTIVPPPGGPHRELGRRAAHQLGPPHVQPRDRAPALGLDRLGRGEVLAAGVVDEHVEAAVALEAGADDALGVGGLADVARPRRRRRPDLRRGLGEHLAPAGPR